MALIAYGLVAVVAVVAGVIALTSGDDDEEQGVPTTGPDVASTETTGGAGTNGTQAPSTTGAPSGPEPIGNTTPTTPEPPPDGSSSPGGSTVDRNPLNGAPLAEGSSNRIIAVKVDNVGDARPQLGLIEAEMIIETPVEGGLTRFTALYFDERPRGVGPVRSMRPVDADLLAPFNPILVSTGGQPFVTREIVAAGIEILDTTSADFFQSIPRVAPHDIVATVARVAAEREPGAPVATPFQFGDEPLGGAAAATVRIPFSSSTDVEWRYEGEQWVRYENGEVFDTLVDIGTGELTPLTADTVVVLSVAQRSAGYTDSAGADVPTFDVIGFGSFMAFSEGSMVTGEWRRSSQRDGYFLVGRDGGIVTLPTGRVFVEIVPRRIDVTTSS